MVARHDLGTDPALQAALLTARRGTAFYARLLDTLTDDALDGPSLLPGGSRRHVVAHVGYNARAITRLVSWAHTGIEIPMYASAEQRATEIDEGATQPARALRHLSEHAAITLDVEWRDTPDDRRRPQGGGDRRRGACVGRQLVGHGERAGARRPGHPRRLDDRQAAVRRSVCPAVALGRMPAR